MSSSAAWAATLSLAAPAIPATLALAAALAPRRAAQACLLAAVLALLWAACGALGWAVPMGGLVAGADVARATMLLLVCGLGAIVVRYARTYLRDEPGRDRCLRWLLSTLSGVTTLVTTGSLLVLAVAWTATSLALHQLLTFYPDRPAALVAAHKKFLVSRLADACVGASLALIHLEVGSFEIGAVLAWIGARSVLPASMQAAAVLLVVAVALRSAQLPFHGWLMQVMEAPTPVSALLHAGVVNLGGFVLITLAPWIDAVEIARILLVAVGLVTVVVAALVTTTRVSVKVALAWSTCAQMGFLLVQCGLGLWSLALLHVLAHSLYKAHAFLRAGSAVDQWRTKSMAPIGAPPSLARMLAASVVGVGCAMSCVALLSLVLPQVASHGALDWLFAVLVGAAVVPLLVAPAAPGPRALAAVGLRAGGVVVLYSGWHVLASFSMPSPAAAPSDVGWILVVVGFSVLVLVKSTLQLRPHGSFARTLHPWLFSGLYLDERFTRLVFHVWPPRIEVAAPVPAARLRETVEVRA
ncbi:MAG: NADH-quinone oxidoreductase subunit L [Myxococcales bacterium]|nr:NADH-quinone oxidoreductase subunit L [Myxococcales bacterium]